MPTCSYSNSRIAAMRRFLPGCCSASRRIVSRTCRRFRHSRRSRFHLRCSGLHRYLRDPRPRWLALFAGGWFLQGICNGYYLMFFSVFAGLWVMWFASPWARPRQFLAIAHGVGDRRTADGAAAGSLQAGSRDVRLRPRLRHHSRASAPTLPASCTCPITLPLGMARRVQTWRGRAVSRPDGHASRARRVCCFVRERKAARIDNWMIARRVLITLTAITAAISLWAFAVGSWRLHLFGVRLLSVSNPIKPLTISLLLALGLALTSPALRQSYRSRSILGFYGLAGFLMWLFTLGPAPTVMGKELLYRGPYSVLMLLPGFNALRVPARFWMMTTMCLAVVGAIVFDRLVRARVRGGRSFVPCSASECLPTPGCRQCRCLSCHPTFKAVDCVSDPNAPIVELRLGTSTGTSRGCTARWRMGIRW